MRWHVRRMQLARRLIAGRAQGENNRGKTGERIVSVSFTHSTVASSCTSPLLVAQPANDCSDSIVGLYVAQTASHIC